MDLIRQALAIGPDGLATRPEMQHITLEDLKSYKAIERKPLTGKYRGYDIITAPPPSSGGVGILQMLGVLEGTGFEKAGAGSATAVHYMTEAMRHFFADRSENLGDPDFVKVPVTAMLDPKYILKIRGSIDAEKATPSSQVKGTVFHGHESEQTTHYSIADSQGNVVSVTYTLNDQYGNKITAAGLGFLLNNEMGDFTSQPGVADASGRILGEADAIAPRKGAGGGRQAPGAEYAGGKPDVRDRDHGQAGGRARLCGHRRERPGPVRGTDPRPSADHQGPLAGRPARGRPRAGRGALRAHR